MSPKHLEPFLQPDSPWSRLITAIHNAEPTVARPPKGTNFGLRDSSLGPRRIWQAKFSWEGQRWLELLDRQELPKGMPLNVGGYLSESPEVRQMLALQAQEALRAKGITAQVWLRSSYKTGLFWVLEEIVPKLRRAGADGIKLLYPTQTETPAWRFLQETFPLVSLVEREGLRFSAEARDDGAMGYSAIALKGSRALWQQDCLLPLYRRTAVGGSTVWASSGQLWIKGGHRVIQERIPTDGELFWDWYTGEVLPQLLELSHKGQGPFFRNLTVRAQLSEPEVPLGIAQEWASMPEALAEEVYFTTLEAFKDRMHLALDGRSLVTGRIVPIVQTAPGRAGWAKAVLIENGAKALDVPEPIALSLKEKSLGQLEAHPQLPPWQSTGLDEATSSPETLPPRPLRPREIWQAAYGLGQRLTLSLEVPAFSYDGRPVIALTQAIDPHKPALLVTAGQHANEQTGPRAALHLSEALAQQDALNWAVLPLENPDGSQLHHALMQLAPHHMHHPARYTSLGDDLQARMQQDNPRYEAAGRHWALQRLKPKVHLNLHGYPSHEWTRPFNGYVPRGFESWALPMGVLGIVVFDPNQKTAASELVVHIAKALNQNQELKQLTDAALKRREAHSFNPPYQRVEGFPFLLIERSKSSEGLIEVITEMPDETVYGLEFELLVKAHCLVGAALIEWLSSSRYSGSTGA